MKTYAVKEIFLTLQGEGYHSGRRAVLCRFAGCNGWTGLAADRANGPFGCSAWCDTDFVGTDGENGGRYDAVGLACRIARIWDSPHRPRYVVLTGGEPALQVDDFLVDVLHRWEFSIAIETNGTGAVPASIDWVTVSPKAGARLVLESADEIKLVYPQPGCEPEQYVALNFNHRFLQPMDGPQLASNTRLAALYCLANPRWRLGLQAHKIAGLA